MPKQLFSVLFILFTASLILSSCNTKPKFIGNHLSPRVMQNLLVDINLAEAYSTYVKDSLHPAGAKNIDSLSVYYKDVFTHYNITKEQFTESLNWYKNNPADLDTLYSKMVLTIAKMQGKPASAAIKKPDSAAINRTPTPSLMPFRNSSPQIPQIKTVNHKGA